MTLATKATRGAVAGNNWTNPANALSDNSVYATAAPSKNGHVTGDWDFDAFSDAEIPVGATLNSVTLRVQYKVSVNTSIFDLTLTRKNGGASDGTTNDATEPLADTNLDSAFATLPSEANLKSAGQVSVGCDAHRGNSNTAVTASIDYIELRVDYTPGPALFVGSSAGTGTAGATLTTSISIAGSSAGAATAGAGLTTAVTLAGSSDGTATADGVLSSAGVTFVGSSAGTSTSTAALTTAIALIGSSVGAGTSAGALTTAISLAGSSGGISTSNGALTTSIVLAGTSDGIATGSAILTDASAATLFVGSAAGVGTASADLTTTILFTASVAGAASVSGLLSTAISLAGSAAGQADGIADLTTTPSPTVGGVAPRSLDVLHALPRVTEAYSAQAQLQAVHIRPEVN